MKSLTQEKSKPLVLIVDDEKSNTFLLSRILGKLDCDIRTASHGWEALEYATKEVFALILLDILMPELNGYETLIRIKSSTINWGTPVFLMTEMETDQTLLLKAYNAGAVDFIQKPVNLKVLQRKTKYFLDFFNQKEELREATAKAESLMKQRMSIMADITHELRTPLFAMLGMIESLKEIATNNEQKYLIQRMEINSENLLDTVNEFLDFSKLESGEQGIEYEYFSLKKMAQDLMSIMKFQLHKNKDINLELSIEKDVSDFIRSDKKKIRHILMNLFSNAIKFTQEGSIKLQVRDVGEKNGKPILKFSVIDTGIGIPPDKLQSIFDEYSQVENELQGVTKSTGLGLSIVTKFVALLGGKIKVKSKLGQGASFSFSIPVETANESDLQDINEPHSFEELLGKKTLNLLILDDVPDNLFVLKNYLNVDQINLTLAHSADQASGFMYENIYDMVFLDIEMPDKTGFEMAEIYRKICHEKNYPIGEIIMLSAYTLDSKITQQLNTHKLDHYLMKPIRKGLLFEKIVSIAHGLKEQIKIASIHEPVINGDYDFHLLENDFQDYLPRYLEIKIDEIQQMIEAVLKNDKTTILSLCHKILGTASSFGFHKIAKDIEEIQILCKNDFEKNKELCYQMMNTSLSELKVISVDLIDILAQQNSKAI